MLHGLREQRRDLVRVQVVETGVGQAVRSTVSTKSSTVPAATR
jgi:hypothetical protein